MSKPNTKMIESTSTNAQVSDQIEKKTWSMEESEAIIKEYGGVSKAIRALHAEGLKRGAIAKRLNKRYQHVRNVLITPVKTQ